MRVTPLFKVDTLLSWRHYKEASNAWFTVLAASLANLTYKATVLPGPTTVDTIVSDSAGNMSSIGVSTITTFTTSPPVLTLANATANLGGVANAIPASSLIANTSDPNGLAISVYNFYDTYAGGTNPANAGHFNYNNTVLAGAGISTGANGTVGVIGTSQWFSVQAADLQYLTYIPSTLTTPATDGVYAFVQDQGGFTSSVGFTQIKELSATLPTVTTVASVTATYSSSIPVASLISATTDANNYAISNYFFYDNGSTSGSLYLGAYLAYIITC